ncbi:MAG: phosphoribosylglycinamide formyltransferase [Agriterribacter sp.]
MLKRLRQKWNVSGRQFFLILCVFAITGTTTAWLTRVITAWAGFTSNTFWLWKLLLRLAMLVVGYQVILLTVAFLFGQFPFFWKFEKRMLGWMGIRVGGKRYKEKGKKQSAVSHQQSAISHEQLNIKSQMSNQQSAVSGQPSAVSKQPSNLKSQISNQQSVFLAVFASGTGSNAQKIIDYFRGHPIIKISLIVSNKPQAGVLQIAQKEKIASLIIEKENFFRGDGYVAELKALNIHWIILAGFLWKVPETLIRAFPGKIINIHPALLPKYGGKGMYGHFVHEAVIAAAEKESGITIHYVDEHFDHGQHILQVICPVEEGDTPESLAKKVQVLEHKHYPEVIERLIREEKGEI